MIPALAPDLFAAEAAPADVLAGLDQLGRAAPVWPLARPRWREIVAALRAFHVRWGETARAAGWCPLALYGLHPRAPYANLDAMGGAWLIAVRGHQVTAIDRRRIEIVTRTAVRSSIYRHVNASGGALPWQPESFDAAR